ncbi:MAG: acyl-CoA desaturase [Lapillicoccus sp.]
MRTDLSPPLPQPAAKPFPETTVSAASRPPVRGRGHRAASDFATLSAQVRAHGLLHRRRGAYARGIGALTLIAAAAVIATLLVGDRWWQLAVATLWGVLLSQFGFFAHDAAHRQVFRRPQANEWASRLVSTSVLGLSYGWWTHKHNSHHRSPNQVGRDPDIAPGGLVFTPEAAAERPRWLAPITRRQGYLFFPMLFLEGANLHAAGIRTLAERPDLPYRRLEAVLILARFALPATALLAVMAPVKVAAFMLVQTAVFGFFLGAAFAPNHKGMPVLARDATVDFLRRQVLMSRNVRGGWLVDLAMGGLNYQIEHHLFPSMPRPNLRRAQPLVRAFCAERGILYTETSLTASYATVIAYLNDVGLSSRDPFSCPFVQAHRR